MEIRRSICAHDSGACGCARNSEFPIVAEGAPQQNHIASKSRSCSIRLSPTALYANDPMNAIPVDTALAGRILSPKRMVSVLILVLGLSIQLFGAVWDEP